MEDEIASYMSSLVSQQIKVEYQRLEGLLQLLLIPEWKWKKITMNFMTALPCSSKENNTIWIIVDILMKSAHFKPFHMGQSAEILAYW